MLNIEAHNVLYIRYITHQTHRHTNAASLRLEIAYQARIQGLFFWRCTMELSNALIFSYFNLRFLRMQGVLQSLGSGAANVLMPSKDSRFV